MQVTAIQKVDGSALESHARIQARVAYEDGYSEPENYWFELPRNLVETAPLTGNPWLVALLPLASRLGEPIRIDGAVDPILVESVRQIMELWHYWFPQMQVVPIEADIRSAPLPGPRRRVAQFFSGGVDSFFTALRHASPDDTLRTESLIFVWGFDVPLSNRNTFESLRKSLQSAADDLGRDLVTVASNLRERRFRSLPWDFLGHGVAMGGIGLHLEHAFEHILIPSTDGYRETGPWGSHVLIDHHMSTSSLRFIHDGAASTRFEKLRLVASSPTALASLRVCYSNLAATNCGVCEKCVRTMIGLDMLGVLDRENLFERSALDLDHVSRVYCPPQQTGSLRLYYDEMIDVARSMGRKDLVRAIGRSIRRSAFRKLLVDASRVFEKVPYLWRLASAVESAALSGLIR